MRKYQSRLVEEMYKPLPQNKDSLFNAASTSLYETQSNFTAGLGSTLNAPIDKRSLSSNINAASVCLGDEEVLSSLKMVRRYNFENKIIAAETPFQKVIAKKLAEIPHNNSFLKDIYITVDTNIFVLHPNVVDDLLQVKINGVSRPIVLIPWTTVQELDCIDQGKFGSSLRKRTQNAFDFVKDSLFYENLLIKGQPIADAEQLFLMKKYDDAVLHCCLQIYNKRHQVMLLSSDASLRKEVIKHGICAYSHTQIIRALDPFRCIEKNSSCETNSKNYEIEKWKERLSHLSSLIISKKLKAISDRAWKEKYCFQEDLPWTLQKCLDFFQRHWHPLFASNLPRQCLILIDSFNKQLRALNGNIPKEDEGKLSEFALSFCFYLRKGFPNEVENIDKCINDVENISENFT